jgi:hypothetical protein
MQLVMHLLLLPLKLNLGRNCSLQQMLLGREQRFNPLRCQRFMGTMLRLVEVEVEVEERDRGMRRR